MEPRSRRHISARPQQQTVPGGLGSMENAPGNRLALKTSNWQRRLTISGSQVCQPGWRKKPPRPRQVPAGPTMGQVIRKYEEDGYPDKHKALRIGPTLESEKNHCKTLLQFWDNIPVEFCRTCGLRSLSFVEKRSGLSARSGKQAGGSRIEHIKQRLPVGCSLRVDQVQPACPASKVPAILGNQALPGVHAPKR